MCSLSSLYLGWQHYCNLFFFALLQFYVYLFEEQLDKETDVFLSFQGVARDFVFSNIWTASSVLNECSVFVFMNIMPSERTKSSYTYGMPLYYDYYSSYSYASLTVISEYLAALMRCIFILMFYFPLNGSNGRLKPVCGSLSRFVELPNQLTSARTPVRPAARSSVRLV